MKNIFNDSLSGEALKNALDFAEYLKANEMTVSGSEVSYKGKVVCYMHIDGGKEYPNPWTIWTEGDYSHEHINVLMDEHMKEIAWANVNICGKCGSSCAPGKRKMIFGKEFDNVCSADMAFHIPNAEILDCIKKLLEMRKYAILSGNQ